MTFNENVLVTYKWILLIFQSNEESLPSQLVDPEEQMSDNLRQTVHSHHNHTPLCMVEVLDALLCIQISKNEKKWLQLFFWSCKETSMYTSGINLHNFHANQLLCPSLNTSQVTRLESSISRLAPTHG